MSVLNVEQVTHGFGVRQILKDVSFRLLKGEHVALVGANGEGKSTFINIITGSLQPDQGKVEWAKRVSVGYLDQHSSLKAGMSIRDVLRLAFKDLFTLEQEMLAIYEQIGSVNENQIDALLEEAAEIQTQLDHSGFYTLDSKIEQMAAGFGLLEIGLDRLVDELSGGQRSKVLLTKLLLQNPTILILDEPTNYLDENHIQWLINYLQNYENAFILVSHDIPFVNAVCNIIYHVHNSELTRYVGSYDDFQRLYEEKKQQLEKDYQRQQKQIERLEDFIARNKARVATRGMANSRAKKLEKMEVIEKIREKNKPVFHFKLAQVNPGRVVFEAKDLVLGYDSPLTKPISFQIEKGQKIAICGVNGLGKSTLLKTILGLLPPFSGSMKKGEQVIAGYFEQEDSKNNPRTALDELWAEFPTMTNHEVRTELARVGLTSDNIMSPMKVLSGGENAKARLCKVLLKKHNVLILDEPTNHLDSDAKEALQKAIMEFDGTVILVSHEPYFYEHFVTSIWNIESWTTKII